MSFIHLQETLDKVSTLINEAKVIRAKAYAEPDPVKKSELYGQLDAKLVEVTKLVESRK